MLLLRAHTTILFWNVNRKPIGDVIAEACLENDVDVLVLAEFEGELADILNPINSIADAKFTASLPIPSRLRVLHRYPLDSVSPVRDDSYASVRRIAPPLGADFLVVAVHLPSKMYLSTEDQTLLAPRLREMIDSVEQDAGHSRTLVIGDFNMDPFEASIVGSEGLHAVMSRQVASRDSRTVLGTPRQMFYNPMWGRLGDMSYGPPGTYYYDQNNPVTYFWHSFDQVLIRPSLLDSFDHEGLKVLDQIGNRSLLSNSGRPESNTLSDHLPLLVRLMS